MNIRLKLMPYYLGNLCIVASLLGLLYIYFPILKTYFAPVKVIASTPNGITISIPKINAYSPVIQDVNPWNENVYKEALKKGVAHAKGTALPGGGEEEETGVSFLFAHSGGMPWEATRYNTIFFRLGELENGDKIFITRDGKTYSFLVREKKIVWPEEVGFLLREKDSVLILQTCWPVGTPIRRLLVFADSV